MILQLTPTGNDKDLLRNLDCELTKVIGVHAHSNTKHCEITVAMVVRDEVVAGSLSKMTIAMRVFFRFLITFFELLTQSF